LTHPKALLTSLSLACASPLVLPGETGEDRDSAATTEVDLSDCVSTYAGIGQPFALTWCTGCHSSARTDGDRFDAPEGVDLDTLADLRTHAERAAIRVSDGTMPPTGGISEAEQTRFLDWLACGAAGEENPLPASSAEVGPVSAEMIVTSVSADSDLLTLLHASPEESVPSAELLLRESGDSAWLLGYTRYRYGELELEVTYDPELLILDGAQASWQSETTATLTDGGGTWSEDQRWTITVGEATNVDGRSADLHPWMIHAQESGGSEHGLHLSDTEGLVALWTLNDVGEGWRVVRDLGSEGQAGGGALPLEGGQTWGDRFILYGALP